MINKNDIRVEEETAALIAAAISAYLGHGDFTIRRIRHYEAACKKSPVFKKSQFISWKTNN